MIGRTTLALLAALSLSPLPAQAFADRVADDAGGGLPPETVIAEVDGSPVRARDFGAEAASVEWEHLKGRLPRTVWRMKVLERLIENEAVLREAERDGSLRAPQLVLMRAQLVDLLLAGAYLEREVLPKVAVTDAEVAARLPQGGTALDLELLRFEGRAAAEEGRRRAAAGESFAQLAAAGVGASVGWGRTGLVTRGSGQFEPAVEEVLFALPEGGVSEPYVGHDGALYLARVARRETENARADQMRAESQRQTLLTDRREEAGRELRARLFREDGIELRHAGIQRAAGQGCADFEAPCAREEIGVDRAGRHTFGELLAFKELLVELKRYKSRLKTTPWIELADQLLFQLAAARRARDAGVDRVPEVRAAIAAEDRKLVFGGLRRRVLAGVEVGDGAVRAYFDENRARFVLPEKRTVRMIALAKEGDAKAVAQLLREGADFTALARERSLDDSAKEGGELGALTRAAAEAHPRGIVELAFSLAKGEVSAPYKVDGRYHLVRVDAIAPARDMTYEEARASIRAALEQKASEEALDRYIRAARSKVKVTIHEDRLPGL